MIRSFAFLLCVGLSMGCAGARDGATARAVTPSLSPLEAETAYAGLLEAHVRDGRVDYRRLCADPALPAYLGYLASVTPDSLTGKDDQLALWINAYNAVTLKVICDAYPVESINDLHFGGRVIGFLLKKTVWDRKLAVVGGRRLTLNDIEHGIIRKRFKDPRAHFALVCASKSCPPLRSEPYRGADLDRQLDDQGRIFFADPARNEFDAVRKKARLSSILGWYRSDFGVSDREVLLFAARFLPDSLAAEIRRAPEAWSIDHTRYDWSLNE